MDKAAAAIEKRAKWAKIEALGAKTLSVVPEFPAWKKKPDGFYWSDHNLTNRGPDRIAVWLTSSGDHYDIHPVYTFVDASATVPFCIKNCDPEREVPTITLHFVYVPRVRPSERGFQSAYEVFKWHTATYKIGHIAPLPHGVLTLRRPVQPMSWPCPGAWPALLKAEELGKNTLMVVNHHLEWTNRDRNGNESPFFQYSYHDVTNIGPTQIALKVTCSDNVNYRFDPVYTALSPGETVNIAALRLDPAAATPKIALHFLLADAFLPDAEAAQSLWDRRAPVVPDGIFVFFPPPPTPLAAPELQLTPPTPGSRPKAQPPARINPALLHADWPEVNRRQRSRRHRSRRHP